MGSKKILPTVWLIQDGAMANTDTITSAGINVSNLDNIAFEITWTGTPTGTISILGSVSASFAGATPNYHPLTFSPPLTQPAGSSGGYIVDLNQFPFPFLQVQYVNASGTGTLEVYLSGKDVN